MRLAEKSPVVHTGQWWLVVFLPFGGGGGLTLGRHIYVPGADIDPCVLEHEMVHVEQWGGMGAWRFLWRYGLGLWWVWRHRLPITEHPLEKPAYAVEWACRSKTTFYIMSAN